MVHMKFLLPTFLFLVPTLCKAAPALRSAADDVPSPPPPPATAEQQVNVLWESEIDVPLTLAPVLSRSNTTVYVAAETSITCLSITDGRQLWSTPLGGEIVSILASPSDSVVYVTAKNDALYAITTSTGAVAWTHLADNTFVQTAQPPLAVSADGTKVYVATMDATLYALNAVSGARLPDWSAKVTTYPGGISASTGTAVAWAVPPLVVSDRLYSVDNNGTVYCFGAGGKEAKKVWQVQIAGQPSPLPMVASLDGKVVYVSTRGDGWIRALRAADGSLLWRASLSMLGDLPFFERPATTTTSQASAGKVGSGLLIVPMDNGVIKSIETRTGTIARSLDLGQQLQTPVMLGGAVMDNGVSDDVDGDHPLYLMDSTGMQVLVVDMSLWAVTQRLTGVSPEVANNNNGYPVPPTMPMEAVAAAATPATDAATTTVVATQPAMTPPVVARYPLNVRPFAPVVVSDKGGKRYMIMGRRLDGYGMAGRGVVSKVLLSP